MSGVKVVKKQEIDNLKKVEDLFYDQCEKKKELETKLERECRMRQRLQEKIQGTRSCIYDIKKDKLGNDSYICVQDMRVPCCDYKACTCFMKGDLNLFVINEIIHTSRGANYYMDMPHLRASFSKGHVKIDELHSDIYGGKYENKGYATMMVESLKRIAKEAGCSSIGGMLSYVDAKTDEKKKSRNEFYKKRGFEVTYTDETQANGWIHMEI